VGVGARPQREDGLGEEATCGKGLAANSTLPTKLGDLLAAVADVLATHTKALDLEDNDSRQEYDAYMKLIDQHRRAAVELHSISEQMASYRDLPMGPHDLEVLSSPEAADVFEELVNLEQELLSLLEERLDEHRPLLGELRAASRRRRAEA
jgi:hypothetical protein